MKFKTTKKQMKDNYNKIISIGYCNAQHLLRFCNPIAYSARVEGWACDYYDIDGVLISTGYSPLAGNIKVDYETTHKYDSLAHSIVCDYALNYDTKKEHVNNLLKQYVEEVQNK